MQERSQITRDSLLEAALELFAAKGFAQVSVREIVEKAGVAKGTFYVHFEAKEDILMALMHATMLNYQQRIELLEREPPSLDGLERLLLAMADLMQKDARVTAMIHKIGNVELLQPTLEARFEHMLVRPVIAWMDRAVAAGVVRPLPTTLYARLIVNFCHNALESSFLTGYPDTIDHVSRELSIIVRQILHPCKSE